MIRKVILLALIFLGIALTLLYIVPNNFYLFLSISFLLVLTYQLVLKSWLKKDTQDNKNNSL